MNIDFDAAPGFSAYVLLLMFSGVAMIIMASPTVKHSTNGLRALNGLFGVGFLGYGFYLAFLFDGGGYLIFFKAFILPVLLLIRTVRTARASRSPQLPAPADSAVPDQRTAGSPSPSESALPAGSWAAPDAHGGQRVEP
jgi:hypothetical protein